MGYYANNGSMTSAGSSMTRTQIVIMPCVLDIDGKFLHILLVCLRLNNQPIKVK